MCYIPLDIHKVMMSWLVLVQELRYTHNINVEKIKGIEMNW
jgi:hypothetical protein